MTLIVAALLSLFVLNSVICAKKILAVIALIALFYVHIPIAIGLTLTLAAVLYYS